jgi:hypothetical protein
MDLTVKGLSTAGKPMSIITSAFSPRVRISIHANRLVIVDTVYRDLTGQFQMAYRALCPLGWVERWDDQMGETAVEISSTFTDILQKMAFSRSSLINRCTMSKPTINISRSVA